MENGGEGTGGDGASSAPRHYAAGWMDPARQAAARVIDPATGRAVGLQPSDYVYHPQPVTGRFGQPNHAGFGGMPAGTTPAGGQAPWLAQLMHVLSGGTATPVSDVTAPGSPDPWSEWRQGHHGGGGAAGSAGAGSAATGGTSLGNTSVASTGGGGGFASLLSWLRGH
jgi:hypothetical protein